MKKLTVLILSIIFMLFASSCSLIPTTKTYTLKESFSKIDINIDSGDINIFPSKTNETIVKSAEQSQIYTDVRVVDGTLVIEKIDKRNFFERFLPSLYCADIYLTQELVESLDIEYRSCNVTIHEDFTFSYANLVGSTGEVELKSNVTNKLNIEMSTGDIKISDCNPKEANLKSTSGDIEIKSMTTETLEVETTTGDIKIIDCTADQTTVKSSTGDIEVKNISNSSLEIKTTSGKIGIAKTNDLTNVIVEATTGNVTLTNVNCNKLGITTTTGNIKIVNTLVEKNFNANSTTGNVYLQAFDAENIYVTTTTGSIEGTLLSSKFFVVKSDTGETDVPASRDGGDCRINTTTGDITMTIKGE